MSFTAAGSITPGPPGIVSPATVSVPPLCVEAANDPDATQILPSTSVRPLGETPRGQLSAWLDEGSIRVIVPSYSLLTQTPLPATWMECGPSPTAIVCTASVDLLIRVTLCDSWLATQTSLGVRAIPRGPPPTGMEAPGCRVTGSNSETVPRVSLQTQMAVASTAMPLGLSPTWTGLSARPEPGSMRWMVSSPRLATHTPLGSAAMATGWLPTTTRSTGVFVFALIRVTVPSPKLTTQTSLPVTATSFGRAPTGMVSTTARVSGLIRETVPSIRFATHSEPAPKARPSGLRPTLTESDRPPAASTEPTLLAGNDEGPVCVHRGTSRIRSPAVRRTARAAYPT